MSHRVRAALIGFGGIARTVLHAVKQDRDFEIVNVLVRDTQLASAKQELPAETVAVTRVEQFDPSVTLVIETAGQSAVAEYGTAVLEGGRNLAIISAGALADEPLLRSLRSCAAERGREMHVLSGALGGFDALASAKSGGLWSVSYTGTKPAQAWLGTPAESTLNLTGLPQVIFEGNARQAARMFPKNANVAATVALVGIGFENTSVTLIADPFAQRNAHLVEAEGETGSLRCEVRLNPVAGNPKTSLVTAYSVVHYLKTGYAALRI